MSKRILLACCMTISMQAFAQTDQHIVVKEYNGKAQKAPISQVGVTVTNAGATMTDAKGEATLHFRTLKPGDKVQVRRIEKAGYEVFNKDATDQWIVSGKESFSIILCRSDRFKAMRDNYMQKSSASYERQLKKDKAKLEAERKAGKLKEEEFKKQLQQLQDEYDEQLENLENYVERFARIDLSEINSQEQELIDLVQQGRMDEAVELYEKYDFLGRYQKETKDIEKIDAATARLQQLEEQKREERAKIQAAIGRQVATYRLAGGRENFAKVTALLKGLADADLTNPETVYQYAEHAYHQENYADCEHYLNIYLQLESVNSDLKCGALQLLSFCYQEQRDYEKAEDTMLRVAVIRKKDYEESPERYLYLYAMIQRDLSNFYVTTNQFDKAAEWTDSALANYEKLYADPVEGEYYWGGLAQIYNNKALICLVNDDIETAEQMALKGYEVSKKNYKEEELLQSQIYITVLNGLGQIYYILQDWEKQAPFIYELVQINEKEYKKNPEANMWLLQGAYNNYSESLLHLGRLEESEAYFLKSKELLDQLLEKNGEMYAVDACMLYDVGAHLYDTLGQTEKAVQYATDALAAFEKMQPEDQEGNIELKTALEELLNKYKQ